MKKKLKRRFFCYDDSKKVSGHPAYVYGEDGSFYQFVGLTSSPITQGTKNVKLSASPNPNNHHVQYVRPNPDIDPKKFFNSRKKNWKFRRKDRYKIRKIIEKKR